MVGHLVTGCTSNSGGGVDRTHHVDVGNNSDGFVCQDSRNPKKQHEDLTRRQFLATESKEHINFRQHRQFRYKNFGTTLVCLVIVTVLFYTVSISRNNNNNNNSQEVKQGGGPFFVTAFKTQLRPAARPSIVGATKKILGSDNLFTMRPSSSILSMISPNILTSEDSISCSTSTRVECPTRVIPRRKHSFFSNKLSKKSTSSLQAVSKQQTCIYDGAEFISIASFLWMENQQLANDGLKVRWKNSIDYEMSNDVKRIPTKRAGYMTFVVGTVEGRSPYKKGTRIIGIQCHGAKRRSGGDSSIGDNKDDDEASFIESPEALVWLDSNVAVYADSIAQVPFNIKDVDAISTAAAALCGIHCSVPSCKDSSSKTKETQSSKTPCARRAVVLGGSEYALFTAKGLRAKGVEDVSLVTNRPSNMMFSSSGKVNILPPTMEQEMEVEEEVETMDAESGTYKTHKETSMEMMDVGFADYLEEFDTVVDTIGDEANLIDVIDLPQGMRRSQGGGCVGAAGPVGVCAKLFRDHGCSSYISTLTQSQHIVLEEGILFARTPVIDHQKRFEKQQPPLWRQIPTGSSSSTTNGGGYLPMVAPMKFGSQTLDPLFQSNVLYPSKEYNNEIGSHNAKSIFVRGWSMSDYTEQTLWPRYEPLADSNLSIRYGFPAIEELTLEAAEDLIRAKFTANAQSQYNNNNNKKSEGETTTTKTSTKKKYKEPPLRSTEPLKNENPYVLTVRNLVDLNNEIIEPQQDAVVFVSAHYCKLCASLKPGFTRLARLMQEAAVAEEATTELASDIIASSSATSTDSEKQEHLDHNSEDSSHSNEGDSKNTTNRIKNTSRRRLMFVNANAKGQTGKQMTYSLGVEFVPTFLLYKKGKRYGEPMAINKFPSKQLELAVLYLLSDKEWDPDLFGTSSTSEQGGNIKRTKLQ